MILSMALFSNDKYCNASEQSSDFINLSFSDSENILFRNTTGHILDLAIDGDYLYAIIGGGGLVILDISDPENSGSPVYVTNTSEALGVFISGNYAYIHTEDTLGVIDISDPQNPGVPIYLNIYDEKTPFTFDIINMFIEGSFAYFAIGYQGMIIVDISDPENPGELIYYKNLDSIQSIYVVDDYAYLVPSGSGIYILDVSNPYNLGESSHFNSLDIYGPFIVIEGTYAYTRSSSGGLMIIDISDPQNPRNPINYNFRIDDYEMEDLYINKSKVYCAYGIGFFAVDVSDCENLADPSYVNLTTISNYIVKSIVATEKYVYVATGFDLLFIRADEIETFTPVITFPIEWIMIIIIFGIMGIIIIKKMNYSHKDTIERERIAHEKAERVRIAREVAEKERKKQELETQKEKLRELMEHNQSLSVSYMAQKLQMDEDILWNHIFDWAIEFRFTIEGENVLISSGDLDRFMNSLDAYFEDWEQKEISKEGKI